MAVLTSSGVTLGSGDAINGRPFLIQQVWTGNSTAGGSTWANGFQTNDFSIPAKSKLQLWYYIPMRNDSASWGGGFTRLYYRINSGGWTELGHSGWGDADEIMCYYSNNTLGRIAHAERNVNFDFSAQTSNFTVGFLFQHLTHNSTVNINNAGENNIGNGDATYTGTASNFRQKVILYGISYG